MKTRHGTKHQQIERDRHIEMRSTAAYIDDRIWKTGRGWKLQILGQRKEIRAKGTWSWKRNY